MGTRSLVLNVLIDNSIKSNKWTTLMYVGKYIPEKGRKKRKKSTLSPIVRRSKNMLWYGTILKMKGEVPMETLSQCMGLDQYFFTQ